MLQASGPASDRDRERSAQHENQAGPAESSQPAVLLPKLAQSARPVASVRKPRYPPAQAEPRKQSPSGVEFRKPSLSVSDSLAASYPRRGAIAADSRCIPFIYTVAASSIRPVVRAMCDPALVLGFELPQRNNACSAMHLPARSCQIALAILPFT